MTLTELPQWKVDTTEFEVTSDAAGANPFVSNMNSDAKKAIVDDLAADHGVTVSVSALRVRRRSTSTPPRRTSLSSWVWVAIKSLTWTELCL